MSELSSEIEQDVLSLLSNNRVVEIKSDKEYNVYLKKKDESFFDSMLNADIKQVHPLNEQESCFIVRVLMVNHND